ncbi:GTPase ObgE [bacterium]|nr:MAG: GTPase ObgE [bacterium]
MRFVDEVELLLGSGKGGRGAVSFRREKFVPRGGPDGGDGGDGGSVVLLGDSGMQSLLDFRQKKMIRASDGEAGMSTNKNGKMGEDVIIRVPVGTMVFDAATGELMSDITKPGEPYVLLEGGKGGRGNSKFATSTNRVPVYAQPGLPGVEVKVRLELKLMADVGLLGFPNAGKSTLISRISAARPKIADYPFTTLIPNLGVVPFRESSFVVADIPGIIEGASEGVGLGLRFLKHVERTRFLLHLVDASDGHDPVEKYLTLRRELVNFSEELSVKPERVVITKTDVTEVREGLPELRKRFAEEAGVKELWAISAVTGDGLAELVNMTGELVMKLREEEAG